MWMNGDILFFGCWQHLQQDRMLLGELDEIYHEKFTILHLLALQ
jgi:hypothetical protein